MVELNELNWRTCGELVDEGEGLVVRVGHCDGCTGDRTKTREYQKNQKKTLSEELSQVDEKERKLS